ncbi:cyclin-dependent kinase inhibitor 2A-like [Ambystoma mexicanum]
MQAAPASEHLADVAARGDRPRVQEMLNAGADPDAPNAFGRTAIQVMQMGNPELARLLLQRGANPNRPDPTTGTCPAHDAAREGFLETLVALLEGGASLYEPQDNFGKRPIDVATSTIISELARIGLLQNHA